MLLQDGSGVGEGNLGQDESLFRNDLARLFPLKTERAG